MKLNKLTKRYPFNTSSLVLSTLDLGYVKIAWKYIKEKINWFDDIIVRRYENKFAKKNKREYKSWLKHGNVFFNSHFFWFSWKHYKISVDTPIFMKLRWWILLWTKELEDKAVNFSCLSATLPMIHFI